MADTAEKKINEENVISESPTPKRRKIDSEDVEPFIFSKGSCVNEQLDEKDGPFNVNESDAIPSTSYDSQKHSDSLNQSNDKCDSPQSVSSSGSNVSGLSDMHQEKWRIGKKPLDWVQRQIMKGQKPKLLLESILPSGIDIPKDIDDMSMWKAILNIISEPDPRSKLPDFNTLDDAVELLRTRKKIIILTGAGVSVSCGIPDFRSKNGIYARLSEEFKDLPDPQAMFDIGYFRRNQKPFYNFAKEIFPGNFEPSIAHKFIRKVEEHGKLLRNYTQNIDALEQQADINNVIECHGSFSKASCMVCKTTVDAIDIKEDIMKQQIPQCKVCPADTEMSIMKPNIVFFGEGLPSTFHDRISEDKDECDLLIVMGSSMKVRPVALIPSSLPDDVPQILINKEPLKHLNFDINLYGNCNTIISEICHRMGEGWNSLCPDYVPLKEIDGKAIIKDRQESIEKQLIEENKLQQSAEEKAVVDVDSEQKEEVKAEATEISSTEQATSISKENDISEKDTVDDETTEAEAKRLEEENRNMWIPQEISISAYLQDNSYAFLPPDCYIFEGAEYLHDLESDSSSSSSSCELVSANGEADELYRLNEVEDESEAEAEAEAEIESDEVDGEKDQDSAISSSSINNVGSTNDIE